MPEIVTELKKEMRTLPVTAVIEVAQGGLGGLPGIFL
jgi:hypothetical protein